MKLFSRKKENKGFKAGKKWSTEDLNTLMSALVNGVSTENIAKTIGRTESAVTSKINSIQKKRRTGEWSIIETKLLIAYWNKEKSIEYISFFLDRKYNSLIGKLVTLEGYPSKIKQTILNEHIEIYQKVINAVGFLNENSMSNGYTKDLKRLSKQPIENLVEFVDHCDELQKVLKEESNIKNEIRRTEEEKLQLEQELLAEIGLNVLKNQSKKLSKSNNKKTFNPQIVKLCKKGYEITHIAEQLDISTEVVESIITEEELWEDYDQIMIKRAEERVFAPGNAVRGREKIFSINEEATRQEEQRKINNLCYETIRKPEGIHDELKQTFERDTNFPDNRKSPDLIHAVMKNLCAFANTKGGRIVIGVTDDKKEVGIAFDNFKDHESYEKNFNQKVRNMFGDRLMGSYETHFIPGQFDQEITLFMISVRRSGSAVYFIDEKYSKKHQMHKEKEYFYIRVGDSAHEVLQDERIKLINSFQ